MKNNIKFFIKCILILLPFIITVLITACFPFGYMDIEYPAWKYTKEMSYKGGIGNTESSITTVILGDSRAMADLVPDILDTPENTTYNLAVGGATPIEMYYTLNRCIRNGNTPDKAVIMFAPFHYSIIDNYVIRTEYFNYLKLGEWADLVDNARAAESETILREGYFDDMLSCRIRFPNKYLPALINSKVFTRYKENTEEYNRIVDAKGHGLFGTADGCSDLNFETTYDYMHISGDAVLVQMYMNKLLKLCSDNSIKTLVVLPPMNEASCDELKASYVEDFTDYLSELSFSYPDIKIEKEIPRYEDKYFGDSSHLNAEGAALFSEQFRQKYY